MFVWILNVSLGWVFLKFSYLSKCQFLFDLIYEFDETWSPCIGIITNFPRTFFTSSVNVFFLASSKFPPISIHPAGIYLLKVKNWNHRTWCGICSKLTFKTLERRHWRRFGVFIVNFEHISHAALVFLLLTYSMQLPAGRCYEVLSLKKANHFYRNRGEMVDFKMNISLLQI